MKFFRYPEDRLPTIIIIGLSLLDLALYACVGDWRILAVWAVLMLWPKACICAWNHHHQHLPTFRQRILNRALEVIYALHTGITTNAWVLHHVLGHHVNYLDQTRDESAWKTRDGRAMGTVEYTLSIALTGYWRSFKVGRRHPRYQASFLGMGMLVLILLVALVVMKPVAALLIFLLPMAIGYIITCWHTYYHHAGLDTGNHLEASYNIMHKWYNLLTGNLGYHTAHHMKQGLHWSRLPEYHREIEGGIPAHLFREPCFPFYFLPEK